MLLYHLDSICKGLLWVSLLVFAFAGYAYRVNAKRPADDPKKKYFYPGAIFLAPITWPLFLFGSLSLFIIKALAYGVFLILFTLALVGARMLFISKIMASIAKPSPKMG